MVFFHEYILDDRFSFPFTSNSIFLLNTIIRDTGGGGMVFILLGTCMWNPPKALLSVFLSIFFLSLDT